MPSYFRNLLEDRIQFNSALIVLCFASVLALGSQSAASYPSYFLAVTMLVSARRWSDVFSVRFVWSVAALLLFLTVSCVWSDPFDFRKGLGLLGRALLVFFFVVAMAESQLRGVVQFWLGRALAVAGTVAAAASIVVHYLSAPEGARLSGLGQLDNPVVAGLVYGAVLILVVDLLIRDSNKIWRAVAVIGILVVASAVMMSGSRNAWVSTVVGALILSLTHLISDKRRLLSVVSMIAVLSGALLIGLWNSEVDRELLLPRGDSFRFEIWSEILHKLSGVRMIAGWGILTPDQVEVGGHVFDHPHSMYLTVLFQGGLLGMLLFSVVAAWCLCILYAEYQDRGAKLGMALLSMALVSYLVDGHELIDKVGETWFLFWLPVGIGLGLSWTRAFGEDYRPLRPSD